MNCFAATVAQKTPNCSLSAVKGERKEVDYHRYRYRYRGKGVGLQSRPMGRLLYCILCCAVLGFEFRDVSLRYCWKDSS